jgi:hypothetical protein
LFAVSASGRGMAVMQLAVRYTVHADLAPPQYSVSCDWSEGGAVSVSARCLLPMEGDADPCDNMAVVECGLYTGFSSPARFCH